MSESVDAAIVVENMTNEPVAKQAEAPVSQPANPTQELNRGVVPPGAAQEVSEAVSGTERNIIEIPRNAYVSSGLVLDENFVARLAQEKKEDEEESASGTERDSSSGLGLSTTALVVGGVAIAGGVVAIAAGGGGNSPPTFSGSGAFSGNEDTAIAINIAASDPDSDPLTYSATNPANGVLSGGAGGAFTYTPRANFNGTDTFSVTVSDGKGGEATQTVTVTVSSVNDLPVLAVPAPVTTQEDTAVAVTLAATDVDGDTLTFTAANPANGTVSGGQGGAFTYTPNANFNGTDTFVVTVSDGRGGQATQTVTVTVAPVNDAPVLAAPAPVSAQEDQAVVVTLSATDVDGDTLTFTAANASNGTVTGGAGGVFTFTPTPDFFGAATFVVTVADGKGGQDSETVTVNVASNPNEVRSIDVGTPSEPVTFNAAGTGFTAGDNFKFTDNSAVATDVVILNLEAGDTIEVTGASTDYNFAAVGDDLEISFNNAGVTNVILLKNVGASAGFIADEASAENVIGFNFFTALTGPGGQAGDGVAVVDGNLDDDDDANPFTVAFTDAGAGDVDFTEDANFANLVAISNFAAGDTITVSNAELSDYSFTAVGDDVVISFTNGGISNEIVLLDLAEGATGVIDDLTDVEALLGAGGEGFFILAGAGGGATDPTTSTASIDIGVIGTPVVLSAAAGAVKFTDDVGVATEVLIQGFSDDDRIETNAAEGDYNFSVSEDDENDLVIEFSSGGVTNRIVLDEVLADGAFVADYATAVDAIGFDFIIFG